MTHFFVDPSQVSEGVVRITGADFNHLKNVLRMKPGEKLSVSPDEARLFVCEIVGFSDDCAELSILSEESAGSELPAEIVLFQGVPKGDKMETIIQKAVELGVSSVIPVSMKRCIAKIEPKKEESKIKRYQAVAESAAKQSGRNRIPEIGSVMTLKEALGFCAGFEHIFVPYECAEDMEYTRKQFSSVRAGERVAVFIGPEGGLEEAEVNAIRAQGGIALTLGKRILRTETAGMAVLAMLSFLLEDRNGNLS